MSTDRSRETVRASNPAPTTSTTDSAIWSATSTARRRRPCRVVAPARPRSAAPSARVACSAGAKPATSATTAAIAALAASTGRIHAHGVEARELARGEPREHTHGGHGERHAQRRADRRDDRALGQGPAHQAPAAGAEREAHRQLAPPRQRARDEQDGDVGARDGQHQDRRNGERGEDGTQRSRQLLADRSGRHAGRPGGVPSLTARRIQVRFHTSRVVGELRDGHAVTEPGHELEGPHVRPAEGHDGRHGVEPKPDVDVLGWELQRTRRHAGDNEGAAAYRQRLPEQRMAVGFEVSPQPLAHDDVGDRSARGDWPSLRHRQTEHLEEAVRDD